MRLDKKFFKQSALKVAPKLLGCILVSEGPEGRTSGMIIETESYLGAKDPASHAFRGVTPRNEVMFGEPGHLYVYFTYGMHHCANIVCAKRGTAEAVLIRALEPLEGIGLMKARRGMDNIGKLCNGPAKLTKAMGIDKNFNGKSIESGTIYLKPATQNFKIIRTPRIGISSNKEKLWRFLIANLANQEEKSKSKGNPVNTKPKQAIPTDKL